MTIFKKYENYQKICISDRAYPPEVGPIWESINMQNMLHILNMQNMAFSFSSSRPHRRSALHYRGGHAQTRRSSNMYPGLVLQCITRSSAQIGTVLVLIKCKQRAKHLSTTVTLAFCANGLSGSLLHHRWSWSMQLITQFATNSRQNAKYEIFTPTHE